MKPVQLDIDAETKCVCPVCPVQADSACVAGKRERWRHARVVVGEILREYPEHPEAYDTEMPALQESEIGRRHGFEKPEPHHMIELYCAEAMRPSDCDDLDDRRPCQCPTCAVWQSHGLRSTYYCLGRA